MNEEIKKVKEEYQQMQKEIREAAEKMDIKEAVEKFKESRSDYHVLYVDRESAIIDQAILLAAMKQVPQKVINKQKGLFYESSKLFVGKCPNCKYIMNSDEHYRYCQYCGQALDWE